MHIVIGNLELRITHTCMNKQWKFNITFFYILPTIFVTKSFQNPVIKSKFKLILFLRVNEKQ